MVSPTGDHIINQIGMAVISEKQPVPDLIRFYTFFPLSVIFAVLTPPCYLNLITEYHFDIPIKINLLELNLKNHQVEG